VEAMIFLARCVTDGLAKIKTLALASFSDAFRLETAALLRV
jgi:hypothetical protein